MIKYHLPRNSDGFLRYSNRYGRLALETSKVPQHISTISGKSVPEDWKFSIEVAEQIALITDNKHMQLASPYPVKKEGWYLCVHISSSIIYLARVHSMDYIGGNPQQEIINARNPLSI